MNTENKGNKTEVRSQPSALFYITDKGLMLAKKLKELFPNSQMVKFKSEAVSEVWSECKNLIFIMAAGIVVRTIAPLIKGKRTDPAVVVLDEAGRFAVSLLSGHLGGANKIAKEIADFLGGRAVITTASDVNNLPSIDLWAKENNLVIEDWELLPQIGTRLVNNSALMVCIEQNSEVNLPEEFLKVNDPRFADVVITNKTNIYLNQFICSSGGCHVKGQLYLRPKNLVIGMGCNSGTSSDEIEDAVKRILEENNLSFLSVYSIATIDKKSSEPGLIAFTEKYGFKVKTFTSDELNNVKGVVKSEAAFKATGAKAVAEPAVLLASGAKKLLVKKQKIGNVTVAIAVKDSYKLQVTSYKLTNKKIRNSKLDSSLKGKIYIVGTGPGSIEHITPYAQSAMRKSEVIVGYSTYLELIQELIKDKEVVSTGMTQEIDRCKRAVELAMSGKTVSIISGGDPGIYAMAGLVFEILSVKDSKYQSIKDSDTLTLGHFDTISVEVIPGISALNACAARLGAPLMHDFACISLSNRLTSWDLIEKRLEAATTADFVIVLYNPKSRGRQGHINKARDIILRHRSPETSVGIVKAAMREGEKIVITNLEEMLKHDIDMQTTVIIGNSQTFTWNNWMITPRGYEKKFKV
ncbi:MAG: precorrin-3B C(17)-methyltransferase [Nitrospirae bacterium]|nr:precorrin-3B C(17)-methyltransferase [Nitrospirota bacterium]